MQIEHPKPKRGHFNLGEKGTFQYWVDMTCLTLGCLALSAQTFQRESLSMMQDAAPAHDATPALGCSLPVMSYASQTPSAWRSSAPLQRRPF